MVAVSVIIPLYNKQRYIQRALDSVFAQTYKDYEVLVVDDGSTDNGPDIVQRCGHSRVRLIRQANAGPGAARNRGTRESSGPYIAFLDADDEWLPAFLEVSMNHLQSQPDCALSAAAYIKGEDKKLCREVGLLQITEGPYRLPPDIGADKMVYMVGFVHSAGTVLCRRVILERFGGFYEKKCTWGEDMYLWLQVLLCCRIYTDPTPLMWYHCENSQLDIDGRNFLKPLTPVLTDPEPIRRRCPKKYRTLLELYMARLALWPAHLCACDRDSETVDYLLKTFPKLKAWPVEYAKLRLKRKFPGLIPHVRRLKNLVGQKDKEFTCRNSAAVCEAE